ncbi:LysR family transcriptional regulator [Sagittula salina]|uniref:LysR family transcriptional regulator n=1 Tax=Sagittula salina TaxID=2820268 RepID=A0A940S3C7_9RHOB|nr:LysR family transcriptional regulator [Sagittula salina]MBP0484967.1 LysR family transcriptional regulator [Sagittula salina]
MQLDHLEDFLALARELNFSRAAQGRNMTQPAFSRRIAALEAALNARLVTRSTRQVALTPAGEALRPRAERILREAAETRQEVAAIAGRAGSAMTLACTHALSYIFVPRWLMQVAEPAELGALNMVSDTQARCMELMQGGTVQFLVSHGGETGAPPLPERHFPARRIGVDRLVPLCAPGPDGGPRWPLHDGPPAPLIAYGEASGLHRILEDHWTARPRPEVTPVMHSVLAATNLEMAKAGLGIAWLPHALAQADVARGRLVHAGTSADDVPLRVLIHRPRARLSPHCEAFWEKVSALSD